MSRALKTAFALSLGAAVSLGIARFSYALMLPAMRADLGWSYLAAGAMNTVDAAGYFVGALLTARRLRRRSARTVLSWGSGVAGVALIAHGMVTGDAALYVLRFVTGIASAATFVTGGVLAARLGGVSTSTSTSTSRPDDGPRLHAGLALGIYYGGTGLGIVASALLVPALVDAIAAHAWQNAWPGLGAAAIVATAIMATATGDLDARPRPASSRSAHDVRRFVFARVAYFLFGLGCIGYRTFVVTLLRERRLADRTITVFYLSLGVAVFASSWLWSRLLQRCRGAEAMALLDACWRPRRCCRS